MRAFTAVLAAALMLAPTASRAEDLAVATRCLIVNVAAIFHGAGDNTLTYLTYIAWRVPEADRPMTALTIISGVAEVVQKLEGLSGTALEAAVAELLIESEVCEYWFRGNR